MLKFKLLFLNVSKKREKMMRKTLCVIGASGLVGSYIVKAALSKGYRVNGTMRNLKRFRKHQLSKKTKKFG
ncbi:MAG: hypothetical protein CM15mP62_30950 [Rhodospirillaceae bacterium]|nr:MAG: hypothetical protein CM15mP62_30950 [Rhodospirillaceae bacterium]